MTQSVNHWPEGKCAEAFWGQHELPPYQELLADTKAQVIPKSGDRWLDLGCGRGQLTKAVYEKSGGSVAEIVGVDIAAINERAYARLNRSLEPKPHPGQVRFHAADFSNGLKQFADGYFDGVISGLSLSYAESYSEPLGRWTTAAYDSILAEAARVLKPGGQFVFSVNVPDPAWGKVAWHTIRGIFRVRRPQLYLLRSWRMYRYGRWLKAEARRGRFHYLKDEMIRAKLLAIGFREVTSTISYAGQAYIFRCQKQTKNQMAIA